MINQQLLDYVRAQRSSGLSKEAITQALAAGGWSANDVNEAFMAIEGVKTPPPPPAPIAPTMPRTIVPPAQTPVQTQAQPLPQITPAPTIAPRPTSTPTTTPRPAAQEFKTATVHKKRGVGAIIAMSILILVLLGMIAVGALAFLNPLLVASYIPQAALFFL